MNSRFDPRKRAAEYFADVDADTSTLHESDHVTGVTDGPSTRSQTCTYYDDFDRIGCFDDTQHGGLCWFHAALTRDIPPQRSESVVDCPRCDGRGKVVGCIDDICHAKGQCVHDGNDTCVTCDGRGFVRERTCDEYWQCREVWG
ncbi:hypothetical protein [Haloarchaeobius sp. DFWS5]|uniref:hypothetical protein n=1 Tax=Haloarchaeobius sp. DFWS5 TaxID=3446114 RepID=UPI003EC0D157